MKDCNELRRRRGVVIKEMRALTDRAEADNRELSAKENDQYSRMDSHQEKLRAEVEREERQAALDRGVSTGNTTTAISADGPITAKYTLKAQYQKTVRWIFHHDAVAQIRKLKYEPEGPGGGQTS
jgi:predicted phage gp36 major capsid-like protein